MGVNKIFFKEFPELGTKFYQRAIKRRFKLINAFDKAVEWLNLKNNQKIISKFLMEELQEDLKKQITQGTIMESKMFMKNKSYLKRNSKKLGTNFIKTAKDI